MKKFMLFIILFFSLYSYGVGYAENWKIIGSDSKSVYMYDTESINVLADGALNFTIKISSHTNIVNYVVFDSNENKWALYAMFDIKRGEFKRVKNEDVKWHNLIKDTLMYLMILDICKTHVQKQENENGKRDSIFSNKEGF